MIKMKLIEQIEQIENLENKIKEKAIFDKSSKLQIKIKG